jgi:hypothetical protein
MSTPNGLEDSIPSPSEVMARFGKEVLNDKNLSVLNDIAANDFVELDPLFGQAPGRDGLKESLENVLFPAFPNQQWVTEERIRLGWIGCRTTRCS